MPKKCSLIVLILLPTLLMISLPGFPDEGYLASQVMTVHDFNGSVVKRHKVVSETIRVVTAYNAGDPKQTWGDPCVSASGENICEALRKGKKRCAANFVTLGTPLHIDKFGVCLVTDRTNSRYKNRVDIAMKSDEFKKAKRFGKQKLKVKILKKVSGSNSHLALERYFDGR